MDPHSELEVRAAIAKRNLRIVGWFVSLFVALRSHAKRPHRYHSHPLFPPDPSIRDIENQLNYQKLFVDTESRCEPFVGAIIGTFVLLERGGSWLTFYISQEHMILVCHHVNLL